MTDKKPTAKKAPAKKPAAKKQTHVEMKRDDKIANVHVDEVDNYVKGGWVKC